MALISAFVAVLGILGAAVTYFNGRVLVDPEGWLGGGPDWPIFVVFAGVLSLSAVAGAGGQSAWLSKHRAGAARVGIVAGTATAAIITLLVALWSEGPRQVASAALIGARAFVVVGPGLIVAFVIRGLQRSEHA